MAQSVRQAARRGVMEALTARRREQAEQDKRLQDLGVRVAAALMERDAAVAAAERRAGEALRTMVGAEGLSLRDALAWCGDEVSTRVGVREGTRLVKAAEAAAVESVQSAGEQDAAIAPAALPGGVVADRAAAAAS